MNKSEILDLFIEVLQREEEVLLKAALSAIEAATESEAKPENQYDTRGLEQSYLAAGQGKRAEILQASIVKFKSLPLHSFQATTPIDISALITLEGEEGETKTYFLLPSHGGMKINYRGQVIQSVSPESPLGESLLGKVAGDSIEVKLSDQLRTFSIQSVV